ncbi:MAG: hypothetical protein ACI9FG_002043, partial [Crocinitomicaceae bacterium]
TFPAFNNWLKHASAVSLDSPDSTITVCSLGNIPS